jgi:Histidine kinase-, DNA gyrase B-, and HSP90-like ATPase
MSVERSIGDINERGYLQGMRRRGYTPQKCILELVANCIDALDKQFAPHITKKIIAKADQKFIKLLDNGIGMDGDGTAAMFSMHRENHSGDNSKGVSGIGSKPATLILSEDTPVKIFTRKLDRFYLTILVPWDEIQRLGIYTGKVTVREMTEEEKGNFIKDRKDNGMLSEDEAVGTTIEFIHNDSLQNLFYQNFLQVETSSVKDPLDRILTVFGHNSDVGFEYHDTETTRILPTYNYFGEHRPSYYCGIQVDQIEHWWSPRDKKDRYIWIRDDSRYEITSVGRGFDKSPVQLKTSMNSYIKVGDFHTKTGCRLDCKIFNNDNPVALTCNGHVNSYDKQHLGPDVSDDFLGSTALVRNKQLIGIIPPADIKISSARGSVDGWFDMILVKQELEYNPVSEQDNRQDIAMGIQENKNQFDGKAIPLTLTRLLRAIKVMKAKEIRDYFNTRLIEQNDEEDEEEDDEEDDDEEDDDEDEEDDDEEDDKDNSQSSEPSPVFKGDEEKENPVKDDDNSQSSEPSPVFKGEKEKENPVKDNDNSQSSEPSPVFKGDDEKDKEKPVSIEYNFNTSTSIWQLNGITLDKSQQEKLSNWVRLELL